MKIEEVDRNLLKVEFKMAIKIYTSRYFCFVFKAIEQDMLKSKRFWKILKRVVVDITVVKKTNLTLEIFEKSFQSLHLSLKLSKCLHWVANIATLLDRSRQQVS